MKHADHIINKVIAKCCLIILIFDVSLASGDNYFKASKPIYSNNGLVFFESVAPENYKL